MAPMAKAADGGEQVLATNRKAFFHYEVLERAEAGIALVGTEVKSIRDGGLELQRLLRGPRAAASSSSSAAASRPTATAT